MADESGWMKDAQKFVEELLGIGKADAMSPRARLEYERAVNSENLAARLAQQEAAKQPVPAARQRTAAETEAMLAEQAAAKQELLREAARRKAQEEAAMRIRTAAANQPVVPYNPNAAPQRKQPKRYSEW